MRSRLQSQTGSVTLVALCCLAVLSIGLAAYLAIGTQAMRLSNRTFQRDVARQLAEMGLERGLAALNSNDWTGWTLNGTTATYTPAAFPRDKFGNVGVVGSYKVRIDHYNAHLQGASWSATATYSANDLVGRNGTWYRCIRNHTNQAPPNLNYWVPEGIPWKWDSLTAYAVDNLIVDPDDGYWYRCKTAHSGSQPRLSPTRWQKLEAIYTTTPNYPYVAASGQEAMVMGSDGSWVKLTYTSGDWAPTYTWRWRTGVAYALNTVVAYYSSGTWTWYRCVSAHTSNWYPDTITSTRWIQVSDPWAWSSSTNYVIGDVTFRNNAWYRCIRAHSNQGPPNTTYWADTPLPESNWSRTRTYSTNDVASHQGLWFLSLSNNNTGNTPPTASPYSNGNWVSTLATTYQWNSTTAYAVGTYRSYAGRWYRCTSANTGVLPTNASHWAAAGTLTGRTVIYAEGKATFADNSAVSIQLAAYPEQLTLYPNALGATTTLTINGGGTIDSYNADSDPNAATLGASAVLAAGQTTGTAMSISSTNIKGRLAAPASASSPYAPLVSVGASTRLTNAAGAVAAPHASATNVDLKRISRNPYIPTPDPEPTPLANAFSSWNFFYGQALPTNAGGTVNIGTPGATTPSVYYFNATLDIASSSSYEMARLNINGPVKLYVNGNFYVRSGGMVVISPNASLEVHVDGAIRNYNGGYGFVNLTKDPKKLLLTSDLATTTTQYFYAQAVPTLLSPATTNPFYGTIYIPNTTATSGLQLYTGFILHGAISARKITFVSEATVHYDTSLRYSTAPGVDAPFILTNWRELTEAGERVTF